MKHFLNFQNNLRKVRKSMRKLISLKEISHDEWLKYRKKGITGTDAGAIVGLNPYCSAFAVYQDKITENVDTQDNEAMRQGRDFEEYVARRFSEETGLKVRRANAIYYNEEHPFMLADFDRLIVGQKVGLECKTVSPYSADKWEDGKIPYHYQLQVQHYLAVSGYDSWYIAALIYGTDFIIHKIERDESMICNLIQIEERFWQDKVMQRIPPDPDGSADYSDMLRRVYFHTKKENEIQLIGFTEDIRRRDELKELIDKLGKEKAEIEQKIQMEMGKNDSSYAIAGDYNISWTSTVTHRLDAKRLKEEKPDIYQEFLKETPTKRFSIRMRKPSRSAA